MVELAQRLGLAQEPGAGGLVAVEVDPDAHPALERLVVRLEQHPLRVRRRRSARAGSGGRAPLGVRSKATTGSGPVTGGAPGAARPGRPGRTPPASHQRRLPVGGVVGEEEGAALARAAADGRRPGPPAWPRPSGRSPRAARARRIGANRSRQAPPTRMSCWRPARPAELLVERRDRARGRLRARRAAPRPGR